MPQLPKSPIPKRPENVVYWVVSGIAGAIVGGVVYSFLTRNTPK